MRSRGRRAVRGARAGGRAAPLGGQRARGGGRARGALCAGGWRGRGRGRPPGGGLRGGRGSGEAALSVRPAEAAYPVHLQDRIDAYLGGLRFAREPVTAGLDEAMRYSLLAGGQRNRPVVALATAQALGGEPDD